VIFDLPCGEEERRSVGAGCQTEPGHLYRHWTTIRKRRGFTQTAWFFQPWSPLHHRGTPHGPSRLRREV